MRHEAGLAAFDTTLAPDHLHPENLQANAVGRVIEQQTQKFRPGEGNQREYHAVTRGWIANEVFRRAEPAGRTMGQFLREEISTPLDADVFIGCGVCVHKCPTQSVVLERREETTAPPKDPGEFIGIYMGDRLAAMEDGKSEQ